MYPSPQEVTGKNNRPNDKILQNLINNWYFGCLCNILCDISVLEGIDLLWLLYNVVKVLAEQEVTEKNNNDKMMLNLIIKCSYCCFCNM